MIEKQCEKILKPKFTTFYENIKRQNYVRIEQWINENYPKIERLKSTKSNILRTLMYMYMHMYMYMYANV